MTSESTPSRATLVLWLCLAAIGIGLVMYVTRFGPGAAGDSTSYLMGAENLLSGNGYSRYSGGYEIRPITGFPPFYSVTLAALGSIGLDLLDAARGLDAFLFGANILSVCLLVYLMTGSTRGSLAAGALFLGRDVLFELHGWVMSEAVYIFLAFLAILGLGMYFQRQRWAWVVVAAMLTATASLTRYVGLALAGTGMLAIAVFGPQDIVRRIRHLVVFGIVSLLPFYVWIQRNATVAGTLVNREMAYHPMDPALARLFLADLSSWFVPHEIPLPTMVRAALAVLIAMAVLIFFAWQAIKRWAEFDLWRLELRGPGDASLKAVPWLLGVYSVGNLLMVWANSTFFDAATTVTAPPRYLAPVFATVLPLTAAIMIYAVRRARSQRYAAVLASGYALLVLGLYASQSMAILRDPLPYLGYTGRKYAWSELVAKLEQVPEQVPIVSNNPEMVYVLVGRPAYVRPISFDPYRDEVRQDYEDQFATLRQQLRDGGVFVVFDELERDDQEMIDRFNLQLIEEYPQARIYMHPRGPSLSGLRLIGWMVK